METVYKEGLVMSNFSEEPTETCFFFFSNKEEALIVCFLLIGSCIGVCYLIEFVWPWKAQRTRTCSRVHNHHPGKERPPEPSTMSFLQVP